MSRDQIIGLLLLVGSIIVIVVYGWIIFFIEAWSLILLKLTAFIGVAAVLGILAWIGYTLATTPPPKPIEEIEKEIEKELKELEESMKSEEGKGKEEKKVESESKQ
ncbi:MAG TPA: transcriptional regulator [Desulfurococcales archaeon]|nr:transcriptional regulator [Desulfurococcales archaeon]